jgi:hypothetical protein
MFKYRLEEEAIERRVLDCNWGTSPTWIVKHKGEQNDKERCFSNTVGKFGRLINAPLVIILRPFGTRESIRRKVDHGGQIVL